LEHNAAQGQQLARCIKAIGHRLTAVSTLQGVGMDRRRNLGVGRAAHGYRRQGQQIRRAVKRIGGLRTERYTQR